MQITRLLLVVLGSGVVACGASSPPPEANDPLAIPAVPAAKSTRGSKDARPATEEEIVAYLAPRPGEESVDTAPVVAPPTPDEAALSDKCEIARSAAAQRLAKLPPSKQMDGILKAMNRADKRCVDHGMETNTKASFFRKDERAKLEMHTIATALAQAPRACGKGAPNPHKDACLVEFEPFLLDRNGWACVAEQLPEIEREVLSGGGAAYVYSFSVDERLGVYELVGRGCQNIHGAKTERAETELVLRGRLGKKPDLAHLYRRRPTNVEK